MSTALRLSPPSTQPFALTHIQPGKGAPAAPTSIHDTMREGLACNANKLNVKHPLEDRLKGWDEQQERMRMEGLRRIFGIAEPVRRGMEMRICGGDFRPIVLGGPSNLHLDILRNKDCTIEWEDVFTDSERDNIPSFHDEMETKLRMKW
ncbi:proteasome maturation factor UMP1-domain-containing protein [Tirmania nivea]|nr:proteasome maturation factor UMP1-domain-containing protein [Tirmania nivea]